MRRQPEPEDRGSKGSWRWVETLRLINSQELNSLQLSSEPGGGAVASCMYTLGHEDHLHARPRVIELQLTHTRLVRLQRCRKLLLCHCQDRLVAGLSVRRVCSAARTWDAESPGQSGWTGARRADALQYSLGRALTHTQVKACLLLQIYPRNGPAGGGSPREGPRSPCAAPESARPPSWS